MRQRTCGYPSTRQYRRKRKRRIMATPKPSDEVRSYLAAIGAVGGKTVTPKKIAHLTKISSKGGKSLTPKKLAQVRAMTEKRLAKQRAQREMK